MDHSNDCAICFELINKDNLGEIRWLCKHEFHKNCIELWSLSGNNTCPLCRSELNIHPPPDTTLSNDIIYSYSQLINVHMKYRQIYNNNWPYTKCKNENHNIIYVKQFGVIGICTNCRILECFNLEHPME